MFDTYTYNKFSYFQTNQNTVNETDALTSIASEEERVSLTLLTKDSNTSRFR